MKRRKFILTSSLSLGALSLSNAMGNLCKKDDWSDVLSLKEWTISQMQQALAANEITSVDIVQTYLHEIKIIDTNGPALNSIISINSNALQEAEMLDKEREQGNTRGTLHGIPVLIKDNINTADMPTTAGSVALKENFPKSDAFVIKKLKDAGAIILGKTNLSEWANFRSSRSSSGWSGVGGQTKNPYALNRNPCGSSSGSGVAVAANLCAAAIGTETDGSIVCPAHANGIVGMKPTVGLISRSGIIPISHSQDTAGPMCRSVEDVALLLSVMAGIDPQDEGTKWAKGNIHNDYRKFLKMDGLAGKKIGIARQRMGFHESVDEITEEAISVLKNNGAEVVDADDIFTIKGVHDAEYTVLLYEFKEGINTYLSCLSGGGVSNLTELINFNVNHANIEMPYFKQEIFIKANKKGDLRSTEYLKALELCQKGAKEEGIDRVMNKQQLDAIMAPTGGPAWVTDVVTGDHFLGGSSSPAAISGYPNITVPAGFVHGLPVGISFFGRAFSESILLEIGFAYEQATNHRKSPEFIPYV